MAVSIGFCVTIRVETLDICVFPFMLFLMFPFSTLLIDFGVNSSRHLLTCVSLIWRQHDSIIHSCSLYLSPVLQATKLGNEFVSLPLVMFSCSFHPMKNVPSNFRFLYSVRILFTFQDHFVHHFTVLFVMKFIMSLICVLWHLFFPYRFTLALFREIVAFDLSFMYENFSPFLTVTLDFRQKNTRNESRIVIEAIYSVDELVSPLKAFPMPTM